MDRMKAIDVLKTVLLILNDKEIIEAMTMGVRALESEELRVIEAQDGYRGK